MIDGEWLQHGEEAMAALSLNALHFHDDDAARAYLEKIRWPDGPVCPHCGAFGNHYRLEGKGGEKGTKARKGLLKCCEPKCRKQFSVTVGTVFERSHIPLSKWLAAAYLLCSSKKGISAHQLHRTLGVTYKTAWFLAHRIRLAMADTGPKGLMGSDGGVVEADETYIGRKPGMKKGKGGPHHKEAVFSLVERDGEVRSFHITGPMFDSVKQALTENVSPKARLSTDEARMYRKLAKKYTEHMSVNHSKEEYVRGEAYTNTIEGFFSVFKRGMKGVYQHCSEKHLHRYVAEFEFRYNNREANGSDDGARSATALRGVTGKRLTYQTADRQA
jgi:transposase-like protein